MKPTMDEFKAHTLHSGSKNGPLVTNPKQAIAIGLSEEKQANPLGGIRAAFSKLSAKRRGL